MKKVKRETNVPSRKTESKLDELIDFAVKILQKKVWRKSLPKNRLEKQCC